MQPSIMSTDGHIIRITRDEIIALVTTRCATAASKSPTQTFILLDVVRDLWWNAGDRDRDLWSKILKDAGVIRHSAYTGAFEITPEFQAAVGYL